MSQSTAVRVWALVFCVLLVGSGSVGIVSFSDTVSAAGNTSMSGSGTEVDPYVVTDVNELQAMQQDLDAHYVLGNDIDASTTSGWNSGAGFAPVGTLTTPFTGTFDGRGHTISALTIDRPRTDSVGLFGNTSGNGYISNVTLQAVSIDGGNFVGGLVGFQASVPVKNASVSGAVSGTYLVGGLTGEMLDTSVTNSSASVAVDGRAVVGGLVGSVDQGVVTNSYATGDAVSSFAIVGGLVGLNEGTVRSSYVTGDVSGTGSVGALVGTNEGTVASSYWNTDTSSRPYPTGDKSESIASVSGLTTDQMTGVAAASNMTGLDFARTWQLTNDYPVLRSQQTQLLEGSGTATDPFVVTTVEELQAVDRALDAAYVLGNDIDASTTAGWNGGKGFEPIGTVFSGSFDGASHTVSGLVINRPGRDTVGLFAVVDGTVSNVTLHDSSVAGGSYVGGLAGRNAGVLTNVSVDGDVTASGQYIGGLVGNNLRGTVTDASTAGSVTSSDWYVGGVSGGNSHGTVTNSTSSANVTSTSSFVGGLLGLSLSGEVRNSSVNGTVDGTATVGGLIGSNFKASVSDSFVTGEVTGSAYAVGGLIGENDQGDIQDSFVTGDVTSTASSAGGLIGYNSDSLVRNVSATGNVTGGYTVGGLIGAADETVLSNSSARGAVDGTDVAGGLVGVLGPNSAVAQSVATGDVRANQDQVGGLVGHNRGDVSNSYATGNVDGTGYVGGLVGSNVNSVRRSYATGSVTGSSAVGGLVGYSTGTVGNSYWNTETTGQATSAGGAGLTTAEMTGVAAETNLSGFDFSGTWFSTDRYPHLQWEATEVTLTVASPTVFSGGTTPATVTVSLVDGSTVTATTVASYTSNTSVATVAANGTVTGVGNGSTTVTATQVYADTTQLVVKRLDVRSNVSSVAFGATTVGKNSSLVLQLENTGVTTETLTDVRLDGSNASSFSLTRGAVDAPVTLTPGETRNLSIRFVPTRPTGAKTATVLVESDEPTLRIPVTGTVETPREASGDRCAEPNHKRSQLLEDGQTRIDTGCDIETVQVTFDESATGYVTVAAADSMPRDMPVVPNATGLSYLDVTVPADLEQSPATLRVTVAKTAVGDNSPGSLVVYHYTDGAWSALPTSVVSASGERIVVEATTTGFSPFVLGTANAETSATAEPTTTTAPTTAAPTAVEPTTTTTVTPSESTASSRAETSLDRQATGSVLDTRPSTLTTVGALVGILLVVGGFVAYRRR